MTGEYKIYKNCKFLLKLNELNIKNSYIHKNYYKKHIFSIKMNFIKKYIAISKKIIIMKYI